MYMTNQPFLESPDGIRTLFTAQYPFVLNTVHLFQGGEPWSYRFIEVNTGQIRTLESTIKTWELTTEPGIVSCADHGCESGDLVVVWSSERELPSGLTRAGVYVVTNPTDDTFQLAAEEGGEAILFETTSIGTLSWSTPYAPLFDDGELTYDADLLSDVLDPSLTVGFWTLRAWQQQYGSRTALASVQDVLLDATERVQNYITDSAFSAAQQEDAPYRLVRRVIGELAFLYMLSRPGSFQSVVSSSKSYGDDTIELEEKYAQTTSRLQNKTEGQILQQLQAYKRDVTPTITAVTSAGGLTRTWGTGRNFGIFRGR